MSRQQVRVLPDALKVLRTRLDGTRRSQEGLAAEASRYAPVSAAFVHQIEQGRRSPGIVTAMALAKALDVPIGAFAEVLIPFPDKDAA